METNLFGNENIIEPPRSVRHLKSLRSSGNVNGEISKLWCIIDGTEYLVKGCTSEEYTNEFHWEPQSELLAYKIGQYLKLDIVPYLLAPSKLFPAVQSFGNDKVSLCPNFINSEDTLLPLWMYIESELEVRCKEENYWKQLIVGTRLEKGVANMLLYDALVGNSDRHFYNIGVIKDITGRYSTAPIFDNGQALLAMFSEYMVGKFSSKFKYPDKCKPFREHHTKQVKLLNPDIISFGHIDYTDLMHYLFPYFDYVSQERQYAIENFLKWKVEFVNEVLNGKYYINV